MSILLTDKEIKQALESELDENFFKERGFKSNSKELFIAKAQLKKVVEWGSEPCYEHLSVMGGLPVRRARCEICWQKLLKECNE